MASSSIPALLKHYLPSHTLVSPHPQQVSLSSTTPTEETSPQSKSPHKGQGGRITAFGGSVEFSGAPYFGTTSALAIGADLTSIVCEPTAIHSLRSLNPDIMAHGLLPSIPQLAQSYSELLYSAPVQDSKVSGFPTPSDLGQILWDLHLASPHQGFLPHIFDSFNPPNRHFPALPNPHPTPNSPQQPFSLALRNDDRTSTTPIGEALYNYLLDKYSLTIASTGLQRAFPSPFKPLQSTNTVDSSPNSFFVGSGLGNDFLTLSFTTIVFSNIITYTRFPITIDANGLSMFASSHFVRAVQQRAKYNLSYNHHIHHTDQNRSTTIQPFSQTILTPNLNELDRLYQTLCKNAQQSTDDPLNFHLFHQNYPYSSQSRSHDRPFADSLWLSPDKSVQTLVLPQPPHHPDPSSSKESQTSPTPPKITTNDTANKSIAVARYLNGATVLTKGETECITNGSILSFVALSKASPRRCGGQGDITTGLNGALSVHILRSFREQTSNAESHHIAPLSSSLAHNHFTTIEDVEKAQLDKTIAYYFTPPMLTAILSSWLLKYTAKRTFSSEYLTMHATSMIKMFPVVFKELRLQELNLEDDDGPSLK